MDIQLIETTVPVCQDVARQTKAAQMTMESVVPDTKDDIGRILSVRPQIYLKSKEIRNHCAYIEGEVNLAVLYINESETAVSGFDTTQNFTLEYELPTSDDDALLQLKMIATGLQARAINPRKVSVDMEICVELIVSREGSCVVSQSLPENAWPPIHVRNAAAEAVFLTSVCEKSLSINEQLPFSADMPNPNAIISKETSYQINEREAVGNRLLVKGNALLTLHYFPDDSDIPCSKTFSIPFSQLFDLGEQAADEAELWIMPTSDYVELIDAIDGRKLLSAELHALTQVRGQKKQSINYIDDAYSNQMPCECHFTESPINEKLQIKSFVLSAEETIDLPEEFTELLSIDSSPGQCSAEMGTIVLDMLCRSSEGKLFVMRRTINLVSDVECRENASVVSLCLPEIRSDRDGQRMILRVRVQGECLEHKQSQMRRVTTLSLDEEQMIDNSAYPSMTAVWAETESVWELAKLYHSSPEAITAWNENRSGTPVFIPKAK